MTTMWHLFLEEPMFWKIFTVWALSACAFLFFLCGCAAIDPCRQFVRDIRNGDLWPDGEPDMAVVSRDPVSIPLERPSNVVNLQEYRRVS